MLIAYGKEVNLSDDTVLVIDRAVTIIDKLRGEGYTPTLRQIYYQFVRRNWLENNEKSYNRLGEILTKGRMAGMIAWDSMEDRLRGLEGTFDPVEDSPSALELAHRLIQFDLWERQPTYVEIWVEKDSLGNVIQRAADAFRCPHMPCRGYLSASEAWRAGRRFKEKADEGKDLLVIHLGDHDPSGIDMTRDNAARLELFAETPVEVRRIALNMDQVQRLKLPPNPAKVTDSRNTGYREKFGRESWELDAMEPAMIVDIIKTEIGSVLDRDVWNDTLAEENAVVEEAKQHFGDIAENWIEVLDFIANRA